MKNPVIESNKNGWLAVRADGPFSVAKTFDCGQCFRFESVKSADFDCLVTGVAFGRDVSFGEKDGLLMIKSSEEDFENIWKSFLSLDVDYAKINREIENAPVKNGKEHLKRAVQVSEGIRILRQDKWEALCSFIISQNNNIPRIKKIIAEMSRLYGEKTENGYAFPTAEKLCEAGEEALFNLKTGFRAKYIHNAAKAVASGECDLQAIDEMNYGEAAKALCSLKGVGPKVAACALLFGFGKTEAFPVDVWIKKVIDKRFSGELDPAVFGEYAGLAQQYLFYCERYIGED